MEPGKLGKGEKWATALWVVATLAVCIRAFLSQGDHSTYPIFAAAGRHWLAGSELYGGMQGVHDLFHYSPLVAALFAPLALLPDGVAEVVWRLLNTAALLVGFLWWVRTVLPSPLARARGLLLLLVLPLSIPSLHNGQSNPLVLGLVLASVAGAARGRWNLCSACVALACLLKAYPLAAGLLLAVLYPRQLLGRLALALAVGLALPFLMQHPTYVVTQFEHWITWLSHLDRHLLPPYQWPRDVYLLFRLGGVPLPAPVYAALQLLTGAGCALLCWLVRGQPLREQLTLLTGLACCWMTAFGPATESSTYTLLGPSVAVMLLQVWLTDSRLLRIAVFTSYSLLVGTYIAKWFPWGRHASLMGTQPLAALILLGCLAAVALGKLRRREVAGAPPDVQVAVGVAGDALLDRQLSTSAVAPVAAGKGTASLRRARTRLPPWFTVLLLLALPATAWSQRVETVPPPPRGLVIVVGGVGGFDTMPHTAQLAWPWAGVSHEIYDFVWTHGWGQMFRDLQDTPHVTAKAKELAALIRNVRAKEPDRAIYLVAKSGGAGLALLATEFLPPASLERLVLLSAAVSPTYDLRPALRATRREVVSFFSRHDHVILNWGTRTFGTVDRHYTSSAGLRGFVVPSGLMPADSEMYRRVVQVSWQPRMLWQGYAGMHSGTSSPIFLASEVAPWLKD